MTSSMDMALKRLEAVTNKLEQLVCSSTKISTDKTITDTAKSIDDYEKIISGSLKDFVDISSSIDAALKDISEHVSKLVKGELDLLKKCAIFKQPSEETLKKLLEPLSLEMEKIQALRKEARNSALYNHLSAISEAISAFGWFNVTQSPAEFIQEMIHSSEFFTNRVLKEFKGKNGEHENWVKVWLNVLKDLQTYVKNHYPSGLTWNQQGKELGGVSTNDTTKISDRSAMMSQLNQGISITKQLKKVEKNTSNQTEMAKTASPTAHEIHNVSTNCTGKRVLELDDTRWKVENVCNESSVVIKPTAMKQTVYIFKCCNSTIEIKGKLNSITLDQCCKVNVLFNSVVSGFECVNSRDIKVQVTDLLPMVSVDKTNGFHLYLSSNYKDIQIFSSLTSEFTVSTPTDNGDFVEHPIPQQFKTVFSPNGLKTTPAEATGC